MPVSAEQLELIRLVCDARDCALMCGATPAVTNAWTDDNFWDDMVRLFDTQKRTLRGRVDKPYQPRFDPKLATPRLPEKEWWPLRAKILRRDGFRCTYCKDEPARLCVDHVVPLSRGGSNDEDNLVACCLPCNSSKSDRLLSEWGGLYAGWR